MTIQSISIRELKSRLAAVLRAVRRGRTFVITDRGSAVARLVPVVPDAGEVCACAEAAVIRVGSRKLPTGFLHRARPLDPEGALRQALIDEREAGR